MSKMLDRIRAAQKRQEETNTSSSSANENIFYNLTEGSHQIRLVGEWVTIHSHWIGNSQYTQVELFPDSAFSGEKKIKKIICCSDFDIDTELPKKEKTCVLCNLRREANKMLYDSSLDLSKEQKEYLSKISREASANERYFFLCIDRDSPEIAPGKKGLKIIEFPMPLMKMFFTLVEKNSDIDIVSDSEGVDLTIEKKKEKKGYSYALNFVMSGRSVASTPLTEEEMQYQRHDIKKIMGKLPVQRDIYENLNPDFRDMIEFSEDKIEQDVEKVKPVAPIHKTQSASSQKSSAPALPKKFSNPVQDVQEDDFMSGEVPF